MVSSSTATFSFGLLVARSSSAQLARGNFTQQSSGLATTSTGLSPVQVLMSQMTPDDFLTHNIGTPTVVVTNGIKNTHYLIL
jgi:hypothetical protein